MRTSIGRKRLLSQTKKLPQNMEWWVLGQSESASQSTFLTQNRDEIEGDQRKHMFQFRRARKITDGIHFQVS